MVVPTVVTRLALSMLGTSVQSQAGFDIRDLSAIREVPRCRLPALFVCAKMDDFIGALAASRTVCFIRCDSFPSDEVVGGFFFDFERVSIQSHTGTHHTQALHDAYGGPKEIIVAEGDHNTLRSAKSLLAIGSFLKKELAPDSTRDAGEAVDAFGSLPWRRGRQIRDVGYGPDAVDAFTFQN